MGKLTGNLAQAHIASGLLSAILHWESHGTLVVVLEVQYSLRCSVVHKRVVNQQQI